MKCPETIRRLGNSPQGNKIMAKFAGDDIPDAVEVDGTNDKQDVAGESGTWVSRDKYTSLKLKLNLYKNGQKVHSCCYGPSPFDASIGLNEACEITDIPKITIFTTADSGGGQVTLSWTSGSETGVQMYSIDRLNNGNNDVSPDAVTDIPRGAGTTYNNTDQPGPGSYTYTLKAVTALGEVRYPNGTSTVTVG